MIPPPKRTWLRSPPEVSARVQALPVNLNKKVRINKVLTEGWTEIENNGNPEGLGEGKKEGQVTREHWAVAGSLHFRSATGDLPKTVQESPKDVRTGDRGVHVSRTYWAARSGACGSSCPRTRSKCPAGFRGFWALAPGAKTSPVGWTSRTLLGRSRARPPARWISNRPLLCRHQAEPVKKRF